ncbi:PoNi-like cognate immunity protein, partial [Paraburkholderia sp. C35]|uniref:PoNi-like cognate immunity protein n=1 Tax=Paraburkholderia sp. C35 TaxID=2126993 RepID=UPI000D6937D2
MTRDALASHAYWDQWIEHSQKRIETMWAKSKEPSSDPRYRPQYLFEIAKEYWQLMFERYSRGDSVSELVQYFPGLLDAWEDSERLGTTVFSSEQQVSRRSWTKNLDKYIVCFWLTGLALALDIPDDQWNRLTALMGNEGEDVLLDRIISSRDHGRRIGTVLCHPKPYARLLDAINARPPDQPHILRKFVENWYAELDRPSKKGGVTAIFDRPYWYGFDEFIEGGAYFGFWCVEAVAAVKAFQLDDSLCLGSPHYPGDLLRPGGPTACDVEGVSEADKAV